MHQDPSCCKKAQRDMDLFYVERNVRIFKKYFKNKKVKHMNLMIEYLDILHTEKSFTLIPDFVFHFFFQPRL